MDSVERSDIGKAIRLLAKHEYRSVSSVRGEYIEKLVCSKIDGKRAPHGQRGFDVSTEKWGKVEVKSRNFDAKSKTCTLGEKKLQALDHLVVVVVKDGNVHQARLFSRKTLCSMKKGNRKIYVHEADLARGADITAFVQKL